MTWAPDVLDSTFEYEADAARPFAWWDKDAGAFTGQLVQVLDVEGLQSLLNDKADAAALTAHARSRVQTFGLSDAAEWRAQVYVSRSCALPARSLLRSWRRPSHCYLDLRRLRRSSARLRSAS